MVLLCLTRDLAGRGALILPSPDPAYTTEKLEALVRETEGKDLIKDCLVSLLSGSVSR